MMIIIWEKKYQLSLINQLQHILHFWNIISKVIFSKKKIDKIIKQNKKNKDHSNVEFKNLSKLWSELSVDEKSVFFYLKYIQAFYEFFLILFL